ncbi:MAG TPA: site-specific tyrosine recombinase [Dehalococcoidales bacterium]|nr:site-specific tyrosine recombinase [Dehalococcoidales bacterium]
MREVFKRYMDYLKAEKGASDYTLRNYRTDLMGTFKRGPGKGFFQFLRLRRLPDFKDVDKAILRDYMAWLMEQGIDKVSISRKLSAIRSFYRFLLKEGILEKSPIPVDSSGRKGSRSALSPKLEKKLPVFLTVQEMAALLQTPDLTRPEGLRDRALLEIMYAGGLRISEIWQLNLENINLESREIRVTGKGNKERVVLIGLPAAEALVQYLKKARPRLLNTGLNSALWLNKTGKRLSMRGMQKLLKHYARANGIEKNVHPHVLRHTFATHMLDGGADLRVVQELLGHADLSSTQIYTHVTQQQARKVYLTAHPMAREKDDIDAKPGQN